MTPCCSRISYDEMMEMASLGAKYGELAARVLHQAFGLEKGDLRKEG